MMPDKRTTGEASTGKLGQTMVDCDGALISTVAIFGSRYKYGCCDLAGLFSGRPLEQGAMVSCENYGDPHMSDCLDDCGRREQKQGDERATAGATA